MLNLIEIAEALDKEVGTHDHTPLLKSTKLKISIDSRESGKTTCFIGIKGDRFDGNNFAPQAWDKGCRVFILDKKNSKKLRPLLKNSVIFFVPDTVEALGILAKTYRHIAFIQTLAITGSSGKTTTRNMIARILETKFHVHTARKNFNNEIGLPLTMLEAPPETYVMILEMGMNHSGEIDYLASLAEPLAGVITNIGYAHIGNLGSLEAIADAKGELLYRINPQGFVFLNREDPLFDYLKAKSPVKVLEFGSQDLEILENRGIEGYLLRYKGLEFNFSLPGQHHIEDLAAALAVGSFYRISAKQMVEAMQDFTAEEGRAEILRINGQIIINDCYNANPSSMRASLDILKHSGKGRKVAVIADMLELGNRSNSAHEELGKQINDCCDLLMAYGKNTKLTVEKALSKGTEALWFESLNDLIAGVQERIKEGDVVLIKASRGMHLEKVTEVLKKI